MLSKAGTDIKIEIGLANISKLGNDFHFQVRFFKTKFSQLFELRMLLARIVTVYHTTPNLKEW